MNRLQPVAVAKPLKTVHGLLHNVLDCS